MPHIMQKRNWFHIVFGLATKFGRFSVCSTCVEIQEEYHRAKTPLMKTHWHEAREQHYNAVSITWFWSVSLSLTIYYPHVLFRSELRGLHIIIEANGALISWMACRWLLMDRKIHQMHCLTSIKWTKWALRVGKKKRFLKQFWSSLVHIQTK